MAGKKTDEVKQSGSGKTEVLFLKEQLLSSERFRSRKDIVNALLSPDQRYTAEAVEQMIKQYMKGQVK